MQHLGSRTILKPLAILVVVVIASCSRPEPRQFEGDALSFVKQSLGDGVKAHVVASGPGEGDSDNIYYLVKVKLMPTAELAPQSGPFSGMVLKANSGSVVELELLYQHHADAGEWKLQHVSVRP